MNSFPERVESKFLNLYSKLFALNYFLCECTSYIYIHKNIIMKKMRRSREKFTSSVTIFILWLLLLFFPFSLWFICCYVMSWKYDYVHALYVFFLFIIAIVAAYYRYLKFWKYFFFFFGNIFTLEASIFSVALKFYYYVHVWKIDLCKTHLANRAWAFEENLCEKYLHKKNYNSCTRFMHEKLNT